MRADLRDGDLSKAKLQRANLSGARLDGTKLSRADLRGALLQGTDLREADLSEALLNPNALTRTHWEKAVGVSSAFQSYTSLHNAGADAATQGRYREAERFFGEAIRKGPTAAISWVAGGIQPN